MLENKNSVNNNENTINKNMDPMSELDKQMEAEAKKKKKIFLAVGGALLTLVIVVGSVLVVKQINKDKGGIPAPDNGMSISAVSDGNVPMDGMPEEIETPEEKEVLDAFQDEMEAGLHEALRQEIVDNAVEVEGGMMGTNIDGDTIFVPDEVLNANTTILSDIANRIWDDADFNPNTGEWIKEWPADPRLVQAIADETTFRQCLAEGDEEGIQWCIDNLGKELPEGYELPAQAEETDPHNPGQAAPPPEYQAPDGGGAYDNPNPPVIPDNAETDPVAASMGLAVEDMSGAPGMSQEDIDYFNEYGMEGWS